MYWRTWRCVFVVVDEVIRLIVPFFSRHRRILAYGICPHAQIWLCRRWVQTTYRLCRCLRCCPDDILCLFGERECCRRGHIDHRRASVQVSLIRYHDRCEKNQYIFMSEQLNVDKHIILPPMKWSPKNFRRGRTPRDMRFSKWRQRRGIARLWALLEGSLWDILPCRQLHIRCWRPRYSLCREQLFARLS